MDHGDPIAYLALEPGTDVIGSDGEKAGTIESVVAEENADIFEGIVVHTHMGPGGHHFADATKIAEIRERAVILSMPAADVADLPKPS